MDDWSIYQQRRAEIKWGGRGDVTEGSTRRRTTSCGISSPPRRPCRRRRRPWYSFRVVSQRAFRQRPCRPPAARIDSSSGIVHRRGEPFSYFRTSGLCVICNYVLHTLEYCTSSTHAEREGRKIRRIVVALVGLGFYDSVFVSFS